MTEDFVTVTNNENPVINLEITAYKNNLDISFIKSIDSSLAVHNNDLNAHKNVRNILETQIGLKPDTTYVETVLSAKVDVISGKGLSENNLTDALKSDYDAAYRNSHTHSNKTSLDNVSGTNTGDQDLSGLADIDLTNITSAAKDNLKTFLAALPTIYSTVGQFIDVAIQNNGSGGYYFTLPGGGTWAYYFSGFAFYAGNIQGLNGSAGIAAGGTVINLTNFNSYMGAGYQNVSFKMLCWRIN